MQCKDRRKNVRNPKKYEDRELRTPEFVSPAKTSWRHLCSHIRIGWMNCFEICLWLVVRRIKAQTWHTCTCVHISKITGRISLASARVWRRLKYALYSGPGWDTSARGWDLRLTHPFLDSPFHARAHSLPKTRLICSSDAY